MEYPTCATEGCDQLIYLDPDVRTVCAGCELRGGPPTPIVSAPVVEGGGSSISPELYAGVWCAVEDCGRPVLDYDDPDWDKPPSLTIEEKQARGLRTICLYHAAGS